MKTAYPTVLEHPRFRVVVRPESRKLAVFFAGTGTKDYEFHFRGQAHQSGTNYILVNNGQNEWYQSGIPGLGDTLHETIATIKKWSVAMDAPDIYCVGASMGGSGAALYGCLLEASVLALGFEARVGLPFSRSKKLGRDGYQYPFPDLTPLIASSKKPFHAYIGVDDAEDLYASAHLRHLPNVNVTFMRHVFHGPPKYLKDRNRLRPLVEAFIAGAEMPRMPEKIDLQEGFAEAMHRGHVGFWTRNHDEWEAGYRQALAISPGSVWASYGLGQVLTRQKRYAEALSHLIVAKQKLTKASYYFAYSLRKLGFCQEAIALHEITAKRWPGDFDSLNDIAAAQDDMNCVEQAVATTEKVLALDPTNKTANSRIAAYRAKLKR